MSVLTNDWLTTLGSGENSPHGLISGGGFLWVTTTTSPARLLKVNPATGTYTALVFPSDTKHNQAFDLIYDTGSSKVLVPFANNTGTANSIVISAVAADLTFTDVLDATVTDFTGGTNSICTDGTYIYLAALNGVHRYDVSTYANHQYLSIVGGSIGHCIRYDGTAIFYSTAASPGRLFRIDPATFTVVDADSGTFGDTITDDFAFTDDYVWIGMEFGTFAGQIYRVDKNDLTSYTMIATGITERCFAVYYAAPYIYAAFNTTPGTLLRIHSTALTIDTYTFPTGQNSVNEILNIGNEFYFTFFLTPGQISAGPITQRKMNAFKFRATTPPIPPPPSGSYADKLAAIGVVSGIPFDTVANVFAPGLGLPTQPMTYSWAAGACDSANPGGIGPGGSSAQITPARLIGQRLNLALDQAGICYFPEIDTTTYHSAGGGVGALKLTIPSHSNAGTGGYVWLPFKGIGSTYYIGPDSANGGTVWIQYYQRWSASIITSLFPLFGIYTGYTAMKQPWFFGNPPNGLDSSDFEFTPAIRFAGGLFQMSAQQGGQTFETDAGGGQIYLQNAATCLYIGGGLYGNYPTPPCLVLEGDRWYEFTWAMELRPVAADFVVSGSTLSRAATFDSSMVGKSVYIVGDGYFIISAFVNAGAVTLSGSPAAGSGKSVYIANYPNTRVREWVDGQPCYDIGFAKGWWGNGGFGDGFGSIKFQAHMTNKDDTPAYAPVYTWVDDVVVSTQPISMTTAPGPSALSQLAATMSAGQWATLASTNMVPVITNTAGSTGICTPYGMEMVRDPVTHTIHYLGSDHGGRSEQDWPVSSYRHIRYSELSNTWEVMPNPPWYYIHQSGDFIYTDAHGYHLTAINVAGRRLYRLPYGRSIVHVFDLDNNVWLADLPTIAEGEYILGTITFFPERNELLYSSASGIIWSYSPSSNTWTQITPSTISSGPLSSTWQWVVYNSFKQECLFGSSTNHLWRYSSAGDFTQLSDVSATYRTYDGSGINGLWTVDPGTGKYIIMTDSTNGTGRNVYSYDSTTQVFTPAVNPPDKHIANSINWNAIGVQELSVIFWIWANGSGGGDASIEVYKFA